MHSAAAHDISFNMFLKEALGKLKMDDAFVPYTVTLFGDGGVALSGIKGVVFSSDTEVRVRLGRRTLTVRGEELIIAQIGGGDIFVRGAVKGVEFD